MHQNSNLCIIDLQLCYWEHCWHLMSERDCLKPLIIKSHSNSKYRSGFFVYINPMGFEQLCDVDLLCIKNLICPFICNPCKSISEHTKQECGNWLTCGMSTMLFMWLVMAKEIKKPEHTLFFSVLYPVRQWRYQAFYSALHHQELTVQSFQQSVVCLELPPPPHFVNLCMHKL